MTVGSAFFVYQLNWDVKQVYPQSGISCDSMDKCLAEYREAAEFEVMKPAYGRLIRAKEKKCNLDKIQDMKALRNSARKHSIKIEQYNPYVLYDCLEEEWSYSDARGELLEVLEPIIVDTRAVKEKERDRIDERRASFQRLLRHQPENSNGNQRNRTGNIFKNMMRKIKGKSEKEQHQERLHAARIEMLTILEGIKRRQKDLEDISNQYLLVYEEHLKRMKRQKTM